MRNDQFRFSAKVKALLEEQGWHEGRVIDVNEFKETILKEGYTWIKSVEEFLKEFGELKISFTTGNNTISNLHFDLIKAVDDIFFEWTKVYSERIGNIEVCPIGQAFNDHLTILMDKTGKVYGGYDQSLFFIGNSGEEAIERICSNGELIEVPPLRQV